MPLNKVGCLFFLAWMGLSLNVMANDGLVDNISSFAPTPNLEDITEVNNTSSINNVTTPENAPKPPQDNSYINTAPVAKEGDLLTWLSEGSQTIYSQNESPPPLVAPPLPTVTDYSTVGSKNPNPGESTVSQLFSGGVTISETGGPIITPCITVCSGAEYMIRYKEEGSDRESVLGISKEEAAAVYGVISSTTGVVSDDARDFFSGVSREEMAISSIIAGDIVRSNGGGDEAGDLLSQYALGFGEMSGEIDINSKGNQYLQALASGNIESLPTLRSEALKEAAAGFEAAGYGKDEAFDLAKKYMNSTFDGMMLTGKDSAGVLDSLNSAGLGNFTINPDDFSKELVDYLLASDEFLSKNPNWKPGDKDLFGNVISPNSSDFSNGGVAKEGILNNVSGEVDSSMVGNSIGGSGFILPVLETPVVSDGFGGLSFSSTGLTGGVSTPTTVSSGEAEESWASNITLPKTDLIYITIERLFGSVITSIYNTMFDSGTGSFRSSGNAAALKEGGNATATLYAINTISFAVLLGTGLLFFYMVFFGLWKSTQDAQIMGKDWNAFWVPFRSLSSFILINPIPSLGGMTAGMVFVIMVVFGGTALASTAAKFIFNKLIDSPATTPVVIEDPNFVAGVAKSYACMAILVKDGVLQKEDVLNWPYVSTINAKGEVTGEVPAKPKSSTSFLASFFSSKSVDPLGVSGSDSMDRRMEYIGKLYKKTGINPYTHGITRYRFGKELECGEFYVPSSIGTLSTYKEFIVKESERKEGDNQTNTFKILNAYDPTHSRGLKKIRRKEIDSSVGEADTITAYTDGLRMDSGDISSILGLMESEHAEWIQKIEFEKLNTIGVNTTKLGEKLKKISMDRYVSVESLVAKGEEAKDLEKRVINDYEYAARLTSAKGEFYSSLGSSLTSALNQSKDASTLPARAAVEKLGWPILGSMYWYVDKRQSTMQKFFSFSFPIVKGHSLMEVDDAEVSIEHVNKANDVIDSSIGSTGMQLAGDLLSKASSDTSGGNVGSAIANAIAGTMIDGGWFADASNLQISPIERVRQLGVSIMNSYFAAMTTISIMKAVSEFKGTVAESSPLPGTGVLAGFMRAFKSILQDFAKLLKEASGTLLKAAFICANIIPAMPYVMMMIAVIGYTIYVIESLIGINFFLMSFGHPDGHDVYGKGGPGISALMTLFLRPLLIVIGFAAGIGLNWSVGHLINITILPSSAIQNSGDGSFFGNLSEFAGTLVVYTFLHVFLAYKSFSLAWELPNAALRWGGFQDHASLGEQDGQSRIERTGESSGDSLGRAGAKTLG